MSIITSRTEENEEENRSSPIIGKVSIGKPADEPVLVDHAKGKITRFSIDLPNQDGGIQKGTKLKERHIDMLKEAGYREVQVLYGRSPDTLNHFRVLRKSNINSGYVEDPDLYDEYDLEPGENLTEIPIMLTSNEVNEVLKTRLMNYDRDANLVYCHSEDGYTAHRRRTDEDGNYLSSGAKFDMECLPFYWDDRVKDDTNDKTICPFRERKGQGGPECTFSGSLYFQILSDGGNFQLGRYFKIETTSSTVIKYYVNALNDIKDKMGEIAGEKKIDFIPLKLEIVREQATRPSSSQYDERKRANVYRTTISADKKYMKKYRDTVDEMKELINAYRSNPSSVTTEKVARDPADIPEEDLETDGEMDRFNSEFDPASHQEQLEEEGVLDAAEKAERDEDASETVSEQAGSQTSSTSSLEKESVETDEERGRRVQHLNNRMRRVPHSVFRNIVDKIDTVRSHPIESIEDRVDNILEDLTEEEKKENYDENIEFEEENDIDLL